MNPILAINQETARLLVSLREELASLERIQFFLLIRSCASVCFLGKWVRLFAYALFSSFAIIELQTFSPSMAEETIPPA